MLEELHAHEKLVLLALQELGKASPEEIAAKSGLPINSVGRAIYWLVPKGLVEVQEKAEKIISLAEEGRLYAERGLPERYALEYLLRQGKAGVEELKSVLGEKEAGIALGWLRRKNLAVIKEGMLTPTQEGVRGEKTLDEVLLQRLKEGELKMGELDENQKRALELLKSRQNVIKISERFLKTVELTQEGKELLQKGIVVEDEISQLTAEILRSGAWRSKKFRRYDVAAMAPEALPAKAHPLRRIIEEIREIFLQMGFREIAGPIVESSFWNFDALFVPQDHPAREMQDTFYLSKPAAAKLPEKSTVAAIASAHESGGKTGSTGWRYRWSSEAAKAALLRTHTTAATIRELARRTPPPVKVFCVGRIFRNEKISFKHLPEFHQIEGIVVGNVNFANLLGLLKEFYHKMGFEKIRFRPGFFPYTEPSLEVEVFFADKGKWLELGGAGIFRPEVSQPLGIKEPVLAWGLGLERLAMLRLGLDHITALYMSDIDWLRRCEVR